MLDFGNQLKKCFISAAQPPQYKITLKIPCPFNVLVLSQPFSVLCNLAVTLMALQTPEIQAYPSADIERDLQHAVHHT